VATGRSLADTIELVRRELDRVYTAPDNPFRLGNSLRVPASSDEIAAAWSDVDVPDHVISFWTSAGSATLFADLDDGQWGLELFDPPTSRERTEVERVRRPDDIVSGDVVVGAFLGDLELVVVDADGGVRIALPLDPRSDWYRPASSFAGFLDRYVESTGHKFWE